MKLPSFSGRVLLQGLTSAAALALLGCATSGPRPIVAVDETRYLVEAGVTKDAISQGKTYCHEQGDQFEAIDTVPAVTGNDGKGRDAIVTFRCD